MMGGSALILGPFEILERNPAHTVFDKPRTINPSAISAFYCRVADVIVYANPARIKSLECRPKIPDGRADEPRSGMRMVHAADLMFPIQIGKRLHARS